MRARSTSVWASGCHSARCTAVLVALLVLRLDGVQRPDDTGSKAIAVHAEVAEVRLPATVCKLQRPEARERSSVWFGVWDGLWLEVTVSG
jgi:hypothetical protein